MHGQTLFSQLTTDDTTEAAPKPEAKGRSQHLIARRNSALVHRYYYKARLQRKQIADVYQELEAEFFLSRNMIIKVLQANAEATLVLKRNKTSVTDMKRDFPTFIWS